MTAPTPLPPSNATEAHTPRGEASAEQLAEQLALRLARNIHGHAASREAYVVSVYGEWGVGKTYCLQHIRDLYEAVLQEQLKPYQHTSAATSSEPAAKQPSHRSNPPDPTRLATALQNNPDGERQALVVPVFFSPWMYEREEHLIVPLLKHIETQLQCLPDETAGEGANNGESSVTKLPFHRLAFQALYIAVHQRFKVNAAKLIPSLLMAMGTMLVDGGTSTALSGLFGLVRSKLFSGLFSSKLDDGRLTEQLNAAGTAFSAAGSALEKSGLEAISGESSTVSKPSALHQSETIYFEFRQHLGELLNKPVRLRALHSDKAHDELALRFVILIDDLDRCLPEKAIEMLEAVKLFLNVPGFAFVLAVDDDVVERGIRHRYAGYLAQESQARKQHHEAPTTTPTPQASAPITGHEYLEKIVHLPQHLNRWGEVQAKAFMQARYPQFNADFYADPRHADDLWQLVRRCVPPVPRKLIRLAEAMEFQFDSLQGQCQNDTERAALKHYWNPVIAARTLILAQLYPEVYRRLRHGKALGFWHALYSVQRMEHGGIGFHNAIIHCLRRPQELTAEELQAEGGKPAIAKNQAAGSKPKPITSAQGHKPYPEVSSFDLVTLTAVLGNEPNPKAAASLDWLLRDALPTVEGSADQAAMLALDDLPNVRGFSAQELHDLMLDIQQACRSRNGHGLLSLWAETARDQRNLVSGCREASKLFGAIMGMPTVAYYSELYLFLRLSADVRQDMREQYDKDQAAQASHLNPASASKPIAALDVQERERWIKAILGQADAAIYLNEYPRRSEPADEAAFLALLEAFLSLSVPERQACLEAKRLPELRRLLGQDQLRYLADLALMQQDEDGALISHAAKFGRWHPQRFEVVTKDEKGQPTCIRDHYLNMEWLHPASEDDMPWAEVSDYVQGVNKELGTSQSSNSSQPWRLPTREELMTLVDYAQADSPKINQTFFPNTKSDGYWTCSPVLGESGHAWVVSFGSGGVGHFHRVSRWRVRLVRAA